MAGDVREGQMRGGWALIVLGILVVSTVASGTIHATADAAGAGEATFDGMLLSNDDGVHVIDERGEIQVTLLDHPVERVFDDGEGGIVYSLRRSDDASNVRYDPPTSRAEAAIWHLPAGAESPVALLEPGPSSEEWYVVEAVGDFDAEASVAYLSLEVDPTYEPPPGLDVQTFGELLSMGLHTGEHRLVAQDAHGGTAALQGASFGDGRLLYRWGADTMRMHVLVDGGLDPVVGTQCNDLAGGEFCELEGAALWRDDQVVGHARRSDGGPRHLVVADLGDESVEALAEGPIPGLDPDEFRPMVDVHDDHAVVSTRSGAAAVYDLESEEVTELDVDGLVSFLRAPIKRPVG